MPYIDPEVIIEAKKIDLLTYMKNYEPHQLIKISPSAYKLRSHPSVKISNGLWCRWSTGQGGRSAIDYLVKVEGMSFVQAVEKVTQQAAILPPVFVKQETRSSENRKKLVLPKVDTTNFHMMNYLLEQRGIDLEVLDYCISNKLIYQSKNGKHRNIIFVGYDDKAKPCYAFKRGMQDRENRFLGEVTGSDKRYAFQISNNAVGNKVHVFESAIDLLSYASLLKLHGYNWRGVNMISLGGVQPPKKEIKELLSQKEVQSFLLETRESNNSKDYKKAFFEYISNHKKANSLLENLSEAISDLTLPITIEQCIKDNPNIKNVILHLDNDRAGIISTNTILLAMPQEFNVVNKPPKYGKDYNDTLKRFLETNIKTHSIMGVR